MTDFDERVVADLRVRIDRTLCVGFGDCVKESPEAFALDAENVAIFAMPDAVARGALLRACASCPVDALTVWGEDGKQIVP